jgi:HAD superfamily hydrolase (TIGR01509 family)
MSSLSPLVSLLEGKRLLIFDFDGTVADTSPLHASAFERVLEPLGIAVRYPAIAGMKTEDAIVRCAQSRGLIISKDQLNTLVAAKQKLVRELISSELAPLPWVDRFLRWAGQHYRLSMATSGSRGTVALALHKLGYAGLFDPLVCADDVERAKPYPDVFLKAIQFAKCECAEALIFEDSETGFIAADRAGISFLDVRAVNWELELRSIGAHGGD